MPRFHNVNNVRTQFTAEEEAARDAEEKAWNDGALDRELGKLRVERNRKLVDTDFYALADNTLVDNMKTYRQELRDLTNGLDTVGKVKNVTWPTKPS